MSYTGGTQSSGPIKKEITKIILSTVTGGATETIEFGPASMFGATLTEETQHAAVANNETGQPIGKLITLSLNVVGLGAVADWTNITEILTTLNACAYVQITYLTGPARVFDSGTTGEAILYWSSTESNDGDGAIEHRLVGTRMIPNIATSVT